ncbi:hypothetical protein SELMODRAFT_127608 [Selaginella moellendorffii]|uniref:Phytoene synthase n=1 Tax=Selaginella moellendorffii TaxID=88036 RepID=D8SY49_SELML|nr:NADH dehydrogenase (ubiquinone) complex I, assembly factor 6 [Selaginella moellendorffii]EFJ10729.1 hypothetical protein SELMODRAFT_127608 [Selaginella moellendorffii]|eukprot:XP_002988310.1 NADH dehydrogenase (ubiquinone) complex I, assembly factor 6 [Selaginella moellendorffii]
MSRASALNYCVNQVRRYDYKNYLCLLQLPRSGGLRDAAFALRAFNVETATAKDTARDPSLATLRLAWWKDSIDKLFSRAAATPEHPVLSMLDHVNRERRLSKHWFSRIIDARVADAELSAPPRDVGEIERYAESTASALLYLTLEAAGVRSTKADHAASHTGKAAGISLLLEATAHHSSKRVCYIPVEVAVKHGVSQEDLYRGVRGDEGVARAVFEVASVAHAHLEKARALAKDVPREASPVMLPAVATDEFLATLMRSGFDPFDPRLRRGVCGVSPLWMLLKLKWHSLRGSY